MDSIINREAIQEIGRELYNHYKDRLWDLLKAVANAVADQLDEEWDGADNCPISTEAIEEIVAAYLDVDILYNEAQENTGDMYELQNEAVMAQTASLY